MYSIDHCGEGEKRGSQCHIVALLIHKNRPLQIFKNKKKLQLLVMPFYGTAGFSHKDNKRFHVFLCRKIDLSM